MNISSFEPHINPTHLSASESVLVSAKESLIQPKPQSNFEEKIMQSHQKLECFLKENNLSR